MYIACKDCTNQAMTSLNAALTSRYDADGPQTIRLLHTQTILGIVNSRTRRPVRELGGVPSLPSAYTRPSASHCPRCFLMKAGGTCMVIQADWSPPGNITQVAEENASPQPPADLKNPGLAPVQWPHGPPPQLLHALGG